MADCASPDLAAVQAALEEALASLDSLELAHQLQKFEFCEEDDSCALTASPGSSCGDSGAGDLVEAEVLAMRLQVEQLGQQLQALKDAKFAQRLHAQQLEGTAQQAEDGRLARALAEQEGGDEGAAACGAASAAGSLHGGDALPSDSPAPAALLAIQAALDSGRFPGVAGCGAVLVGPAGDVLWEGSSRPACTGAGSVESQLQAAVLGLRAASQLGLPTTWRLLLECGADVAGMLEGQSEAQGSVVGGLLAAAQQALEGYCQWEATPGAGSAAASHAAALAEAALVHERLPEQAVEEPEHDASIPQESGAPAHMPQCTICFELVPAGRFHVIGGCLHRFCRDCLGRHALAAVQARAFPVPCPEVGCSNSVSSAECELLLAASPAAVDTYRQVEREASIPSSLRFYCPDPHCSTAIQLPGEPRPDQPLNCHACGTKICAHCGVVWHKGFTCAEYQELPSRLRQPGDLALLDEARRNHWRQCSACKHMIEQGGGCRHMTCKCGHEFCYKCGASWEKVPGRGSRQKCTCDLFEVPGAEEEPQPMAAVVAMLQEVFAEAAEEPVGRRYLRRDDGHEGRVPEDIPAWVPDRRLPVFRTWLCDNWLAGSCRRGARCCFAHGLDEVRRYGHYGSKANN